MSRRARFLAMLVVLATLAAPVPAPGHEAKGVARLSRIGPAPEFALTTQDGGRLALRDLRGKELHGGRIWVKSEVGRGSTFTFTIPERPWPAS